MLRPIRVQISLQVDLQQITEHGMIICQILVGWGGGRVEHSKIQDRYYESKKSTIFGIFSIFAQTEKWCIVGILNIMDLRFIKSFPRWFSNLDLFEVFTPGLCVRVETS